MLFCLLMMGMTATVCHMLRQRKRPLPPKVVKIVVAAQCLGLLLCLLDQLGRQDGRVDRPQLGEGGYTEEWEVSGDDYRERVALEISEREPTGEEADALFSEAIEEIDRSFPGENKSLDCVTEKVNVQSAYADGLVEASWSFEPSGLVGSDGTLRWEEITENTLVQAEAQAQRTAERPGRGRIPLARILTKTQNRSLLPNTLVFLETHCLYSQMCKHILPKKLFLLLGKREAML